MTENKQLIAEHLANHAAIAALLFSHPNPKRLLTEFERFRNGVMDRRTAADPEISGFFHATCDQYAKAIRAALENQ